MWRRKLSQRRVPCRQSVRACVRPEGADADRNSPTSVRPAFVIGGVELVAREAEELGFDDMWVSDHLAMPKGQGYPPPYRLDPLQTRAFASAATNRIGIGMIVLVGPQYSSP
jgi:alkanesulfonate monooxygenase SsuD/methylene tetrahydromethanopterin reductase-like flavin-dependent oxidoreductase (luciferase family)